MPSLKARLEQTVTDLLAYWTPFGINILEYLALSDILKVTAYPIATAVLLTAIGAVLGEALANGDSVSSYVSELAVAVKAGLSERTVLVLSLTRFDTGC